MNREIDSKAYFEQVGDVYINAEKPHQMQLSNIPAAKGFIGREDELKALHNARKSGRTSFVLHGPGGVGKTELAHKFIGEIKGEFQAHLRIDMQGMGNPLLPDDALLEVIRAFEPNFPADMPHAKIQNHYVSLLNQHKVLLFLDNAKDGDQVEPLNQEMAFVIVTSRTTFNVSGGYKLNIGKMSPEDALKLLYSICDESRFQGQAEEIAKLAGHLPMALLPLASILEEDLTEDPFELIQKYSERKELLLLSDRNRESLSIKASFDLSYERLNDDLKERWQKLAVFPAEFNLDALKTIWQDETAKESYSILVKNNLIIFDPSSKCSRLHDLAREYLYEKLSPEELFSIEKLHAAYYGRFLKGLKKITTETIKAFDFERTNIEHGFNWIKDNMGRDESILAIIDDYTCEVSVIPILLLRFEPQIFLNWMELGLVAAQESGNRRCESLCLGRMGTAYKNMRRHTIALAFHLRALGISKEIKDRFSESLHLGNSGVCYRRMKDHQKAVSFHEEALRVSKEIGDRSLEMLWSSNLGSDYIDIKNFTKALVYLEYALSISNEIGDILSKGFILQCLDKCYLKLGDANRALVSKIESLKISEEIIDEKSQHKMLSNLERSRKTLDKDKAKLHFENALKLLEEHNSSHANMVRAWLAEME